MSGLCIKRSQITDADVVKRVVYFADDAPFLHVQTTDNVIRRSWIPITQNNDTATANRRIGLDESILIKIERYAIFKKNTYGVLRLAQINVYV